MAEESRAQVASPPGTAAGVKAVGMATKKILSKMSPFKALKILRKLNQKEGIDCPGCAWPDPDKRSRLGEFCENGVKAIAEEAMSKLAGADFFAQHSVEELRSKSDYWLGLQGRLSQPLVLKPGATHYQPIEWEDAYQRIGARLKSLSNPDEAVFYTSGRTSNEAAFLYQLFVRKFGTNNLPDCSNMCHESSGVGLKHTVGIGKGSVLMEDFEHADLIIIMGQNPGTNHPRMLVTLEKAKKQGAKVIVVNPIKEVSLRRFANPQSVGGLLGNGVDIADMYLQVRINEDVALLKAWMKVLLEMEYEGKEVLDQEFIQSRTQDFDVLKDDLSGHNIEKLVRRTSLTEAEIYESGRLIGESKNIIVCWAMGLTQHVNAVDNIQEIVNLLLMKGSIGRKGAGTCPVRGHSNVQGDRTMGIWERPTKAWTDKLKEAFNFQPPESPGYNVVEAIQAMSEGNVKFFMALGGNLLPAAPDTPVTDAALQNCEMTVHVSTKLNRTHLAPGLTSLILPCLGRTDKHIQKSGEQTVTVENSMGIVHGSSGVLKPPSPHLRSEPEIIANIAAATLPDDEVQWQELVEDYDKIRDLIAKAVKGFEDYNQKLKQEQGFALPNGAREGVFDTPSQKAIFTLNKVAEDLPKGHKYIMMTIRSHDQFNTTIYGLDDRYRGIFGGRMVVFMSKFDIGREGLAPGEVIALYNDYGDRKREVEGFQVVPYDIPDGCIATYFPEANPLVPLSLFARGSHTPASKSVAVNLRRLDASVSSQMLRN